MITLSIDLRLIDQAKCKRITRKNGEKATFCDLVLIETPESEYGDYMVKQGQTKEEREKGERTPILGNGKVFERKQGEASKRPEHRQVDDDGCEIDF